MASDPQFLDAGNDPITSIVLTGEAGIPGAATVVKMVNGPGGTGADPILNSRILARFRADSSSPFVAEGLPAADEHYVEVRITGGYQLGVPAGPWRPLGTGTFLQLPAVIGDDQGVELEIRMAAPASATTTDVDVELVVEQSTFLATGVGGTERSPDGLYLGVGDPLFDGIVSCGAVEQNPGGADDEVQIPQIVYVAGGRVYTLLPQLLELTASPSGQERYDLLSLAQDGTITVTAGTPSVPPLDEDDKPVPPERELPLAYVLVDDSGAISDGDIEQAWILALYGYTGASGLTATLGCGPMAAVDNAVQVHTGTVDVALTASETNYVWLQWTGGIAATTTPVPPGGARGLLLYEIDTDGSTVTAVRDRRRFAGVELRAVEFRWDGEATVDEYRYTTFHGPREGQILPVRGVLAACGAIGDGSSGSLDWQIEVEREGVWEEVFPDASTWPTIENGATELTTDAAVPETWAIPPGARLRAKPENVPGSAGTDPSDLTLSLLIVV